MLSHDQSILEKLPDAEHIKKVNLENLDIPEEFKGQSLSENRFFLSSLCEQVNTEFVGVVSGRYEARYPYAPALIDLPSVVEKLKPGEFYTPWARKLRNNSELRLWINTQDGVHPGMSRVINTLFDVDCVKAVGAAFGGNQFILPKAQWDEFITHWRNSFEASIKAWGQDIPFTYRCWNCGAFKPDGFHTYGPQRHLGFLGERITALFFASRGDLTASDLGRITTYNKAFASVFKLFSPKVLELIWVASKLPARIACGVCG